MVATAEEEQEHRRRGPRGRGEAREGGDGAPTRGAGGTAGPARRPRSATGGGGRRAPCGGTAITFWARRRVSLRCKGCDLGAHASHSSPEKRTLRFGGGGVRNWANTANSMPPQNHSQRHMGCGGICDRGGNRHALGPSARPRGPHTHGTRPRGPPGRARAFACSTHALSACGRRAGPGHRRPIYADGPSEVWCDSGASVTLCPPPHLSAVSWVVRPACAYSNAEIGGIGPNALALLYTADP